MSASAELILRISPTVIPVRFDTGNESATVEASGFAPESQSFTVEFTVSAFGPNSIPDAGGLEVAFGKITGHTFLGPRGFEYTGSKTVTIFADDLHQLVPNPPGTVTLRPNQGQTTFEAPEPASVSILVVGLLGLAGFRYWNQMQQSS